MPLCVLRLPILTKTVPYAQFIEDNTTWNDCKLRFNEYTDSEYAEYQQQEDEDDEYYDYEDEDEGGEEDDDEHIWNFGSKRPVPYFYNPKDNRIAVLRVRPINDPREATFHVAISIKHIISHIPPIPSNESYTSIRPTSVFPVFLEWQDWGPLATRWFKGDFLSEAVCGSRYWIKCSDHQKRRHISHHLDFNLHPIMHRLNQSNVRNLPHRSDDHSHTQIANDLTHLDKRGDNPEDWWTYDTPHRPGGYLVQAQWKLSSNTHATSESNISVSIADSPLSMEVKSELPFHAFTKECPEAISRLENSSIHLGVDMIVGKLHKSVSVHFLDGIHPLSFLSALLFPYNSFQSLLRAVAYFPILIISL